MEGNIERCVDCPLVKRNLVQKACVMVLAHLCERPGSCDGPKVEEIDTRIIDAGEVVSVYRVTEKTCSKML